MQCLKGCKGSLMLLITRKLKNGQLDVFKKRKG